MDIESYLGMIRSYLENSYRSVKIKYGELNHISGLALTHIAPISVADSNKVLIKKSSFEHPSNLHSIFVKDGKVGSDIYMSPLAVSENGLVIQIHIDTWVRIETLKDDVISIRSHGLPILNDLGTLNDKYESLPDYEIVPDGQEWIVSDLELNSIHKEEQRYKVEKSLKQILDGYTVTQSFLKSLEKALKVETEQVVTLGLLEILGKVRIEAAVSYIKKYLLDPNDETRLAAFMAAINQRDQRLNSRLLRSINEEKNYNSRAIMTKKLVTSQLINKEELINFFGKLDLTKRELRILEKIMY